MNSKKTDMWSTKHGFFMGLGCIGAVLALLVVLSLLWLFVLIPLTAVPTCIGSSPMSSYEFYDQQTGTCASHCGLNGMATCLDYNTQPIMRSPFQPWP